MMSASVVYSASVVRTVKGRDVRSTDFTFP